MSAQVRYTMRILILGATGRVGRELVDQAMQRGHLVTAFVRSPEKLGPPHNGLTRSSLSPFRA